MQKDKYNTNTKIKVFTESWENVQDEVFHSLQILETFVMTETRKNCKQRDYIFFYQKLNDFKLNWKYYGLGSFILLTKLILKRGMFII